MFSKPQRLIDRKLLERVRLMPCSACGARDPSDPSHIRSRGAGGPDAPFNVWPHCRRCHTEWHQFGPIKFFEKYPRFKFKLVAAGWQIDPSLWHEGLATQR